MVQVNKLVLVFMAFFGLSAASTIPDYIHVCRRSDPQIVKCIRDSIEVLRPKLRNGISELNVPQLDPLKFDYISVFPPGNGLKCDLKNLNIIGASNFQLNKLKLDLDKVIIRVGVKIPDLIITGDLDLNLKILAFPIVGKGQFYVNTTNVDAQAILRGNIVTQNNNKRLIFNKIDLAVDLKNYYLNLDNLFNGDTNLNQVVNGLLNSPDRQQNFIQLIKPIVERKVAEVLMEVANDITKSFDFDDLFPQ